MKNQTLRWLLVLGSVTILCNTGIQLYLLHEAFNENQQKFSQTVHIALLEVLKKMYGHKTEHMPQNNPVRKVSNDYYVVDVNDHINASVLEFYLVKEFERFGIRADFEYGIYDCESDKMVYGNYIRSEKKQGEETESGYLPKYPDLVYYFAIRFPHQKQYITGSIRIWIVFTIVSAGIMMFFLYVILAVLRQKRFSDLQRDFINNMTHEFKTPLTSNRIAIEFLQKNTSAANDSRLSKYLELLAMQNEHLNQQVERMLQTTVVEKKSFSVEQKEIDLVRLVNRVMDSFSMQDPERYKLQISSEEIRIFADELHVSNALYSLIDNARKYSPDDSVVTVAIREEGKSVILSVSDKGGGMEKKELKKVFRKFYRVNTGNVHDVKGFGLGLYYVHKVVQRHRWKIHIESVPGAGTRVELLIPTQE